MLGDVNHVHPFRDGNGRTQLQYSQQSVWTIRDRARVPSDVEVIHGNSVWRSQGPPVHRGGPDFGMRETYLELHCEPPQ